VKVCHARTKKELKTILTEKQEGLMFIEVKVKKGAHKDLGRPKSTPIENKVSFMKYIKEKK
jgi:phosphonopyruvate decarboxylase